LKEAARRASRRRRRGRVDHTGPRVAALREAVVLAAQSLRGRPQRLALLAVLALVALEGPLHGEHLLPQVGVRGRVPDLAAEPGLGDR